MTSQAKSQTILQDELDGLYTIGKSLNDLATLQSVRPGTEVVLLPPSAREAPDQRVWSISYAYSIFTNSFLRHSFPASSGWSREHQGELTP